MNSRVFFGATVAAIATVAGCSGGGTHSAARLQPATHDSASPDRVVATSTSTSASTSTCQTKDLSLGLGSGGGAAGSVYEPLQFTNNGTSSCTLSGYPGVSFVTSGLGDQVGAAASRNPQHPPAAVTLAPGATAHATVQIVDSMNYSPAQCKATDVSGFRVYPPGETTAAYVPFDHTSKACTTDVTQLTVEAVVSGR